MKSLGITPDRGGLWNVVRATVTMDDLLNAANIGNDPGDLSAEQERAFRAEISELFVQLASSETQPRLSSEFQACLRFYACLGRMRVDRSDLRLCACMLTLDCSTYNLSDFVESVLELEHSPVFEAASFLAAVLHESHSLAERHQIVGALAVLFGAAMVKAADCARDAREADFSAVAGGRASDAASVERRRLPGVVGGWTGGWERLVRDIGTCAASLDTMPAE